ncbi:hypothetical protein [Gordonia hydrophobica]|uniref:hypothetical protein n=1 Tax=Gordonia hydrophobica TaxID=40516 RepID=UPI0027DB710E|nr:hypothetical protein [Gordonia hydrophobica]
MQDLVPVVDDRLARPPVMATARHPHRVGQRRREERRRCLGTPVDQQVASVGVGEPHPSDVGDDAVRTDDAAEADVGAAAREPPDLRGQAPDLVIAHDSGLHAHIARSALGVESGTGRGDLLGDPGVNAGQMRRVGGDEVRAGLVGEMVGKCEDGSAQVNSGAVGEDDPSRPNPGCHLRIHGARRPLCLPVGALPQAPGVALS